MNVFVNGEELTVESPCHVSDLLAHRGISDTPCAVEVNAALVPKAKHAEHILHNGDRIEIVTLVGGG